MTDQARKDLADAYRTMMDLAAWKHFKQEVLDRIKEQAIRDEDSVSLDDLTVAKISECRGRRAAITGINTKLEYIINGFELMKL